MAIIQCNGPCGRLLEHTEENFYVLHGRLRIRCKKCHQIAVKRWRDKHLEHYEKYQKVWTKQDKAADPEKWRVRQFRQDMRKMGKTPEWYEEQFSKQGGKCAICKLNEIEIHPKTKQVARLAVDHDHTCCSGPNSCGKCVRGLLCAKCNQCLHQVEEIGGWAERAMAYLASYKKVLDMA